MDQSKDHEHRVNMMWYRKKKWVRVHIRQERTGQGEEKPAINESKSHICPYRARSQSRRPERFPTRRSMRGFVKLRYCNRPRDLLIIVILAFSLSLFSVRSSFFPSAWPFRKLTRLFIISFHV